MKIVVCEPQDVARQAAGIVAEIVEVAIAVRGRACLAFSGGRTPWAMFDALAGLPVSWEAVHIFQTDERVVPPDDPARTWTALQDKLLSRVPLPPDHIHAMPVDDGDLVEGARRYAALLAQIAGPLDLVHLGLGDDGHTASLVPGDRALDVTDADVTLSGAYQGLRRMTLTLPAINAARARLWLVTGAEKAIVLRQLTDGDRTIPAGRVSVANTVLICDRDAAQHLPDGVADRR